MTYCHLCSCIIHSLIYPSKSSKYHHSPKTKYKYDEGGKNKYATHPEDQGGGYMYIHNIHSIDTKKTPMLDSS